MEIREAIAAAAAKKFTTDELRNNFLVSDLFKPDEVKLVYTYYDRLMIGGILPAQKELELDVDEKIIGASFLLNRREMGIINIGGQGKIIVDNQEYELDHKDALYIGMGAKDIRFSSAEATKPAVFYMNCAPAHKTFSTTKISISQSEPLHLGGNANSSKRTIYKYIHPDGVKSCQLVMGLTMMAPANMWNTMPTHTHPRRIEAYFYFDIPEDNAVFHFMGEPSETRHLVVRNREVVISPSWSIHSGVGTNNYTFIWGMAGENQTFSDMDAVPINELK
jgi:4-deoxy-L-threo-5-hexosulose-uronate ketol-isomerase